MVLGGLGQGGAEVDFGDYMSFFICILLFIFVHYLGIPWVVPRFSDSLSAPRSNPPPP